MARTEQQIRTDELIMLIRCVDECLTHSARYSEAHNYLADAANALAEALWKVSPGELVAGALCPQCVEKTRSEVLAETNTELMQACAQAIGEASTLVWVEPIHNEHDTGVPAWPGGWRCDRDHWTPREQAEEPDRECEI